MSSRHANSNNLQTTSSIRSSSSSTTIKGYHNLVEFLFNDTDGLLAAECMGHRFYAGSNGLYSRILRYRCNCDFSFRIVRCDSDDFPAGWASTYAWAATSNKPISPCPCASTAVSCTLPRGVCILSSYCLNNFFDTRFGAIYSRATQESTETPSLRILHHLRWRRFTNEDAQMVMAAVWDLAGFSQQDQRLPVYTNMFHIIKKLSSKFRGLFAINGRSEGAQRGAGSAEVDLSAFNQQAFVEAERLGISLDVMLLRRLRSERAVNTIFAGPETVAVAAAVPSVCYGPPPKLPYTLEPATKALLSLRYTINEMNAEESEYEADSQDLGEEMAKQQSFDVFSPLSPEVGECTAFIPGFDSDD